MATYTITSTPEQDAGIAYSNALANATRETPLTDEEYVQFIVGTIFNSWATIADESIGATLKEKYQEADIATRDQVKTLLGLEVEAK